MKPILNPQLPFDATKDHSFPYQYNGNQQFKVELTIRRSDTDALVYNGIQTTFLLKYNLPANSVTNGNTYTAQNRVYDNENIPSPFSDKILFKCFSTPAFGISNLVENQIIKNSSYELDVDYSQETGEILDYYIVNLMDLNGTIIHNSSNRYPVVDGMKYTLTALLHNTLYKIQVVGKTINGMNISSEIIPFTVDYITPASFVLVSLENIPNEASVKISSNMIVVEGESNPVPPIYINDEMVDLTNPSHWVRFSSGFNINKNFSIELICKDITNNTTFFEMSDGSIYNRISLQKWRGVYNEIEQEYVVLYCKSKANILYRGISNTIPPVKENEMLSIILQRTDNLFQIEIKAVEE